MARSKLGILALDKSERVPVMFPCYNWTRPPDYHIDDLGVIWNNYSRQFQTLAEDATACRRLVCYRTAWDWWYGQNMYGAARTSGRGSHGTAVSIACFSSIVPVGFVENVVALTVWMGGGRESTGGSTTLNVALNSHVWYDNFEGSQAVMFITFSSSLVP